VLSDVDIYSYIESKDIVIRPFDFDQLQANSYDIKMQSQLLNELGEPIDRKVINDYITLQPKEFVLATSQEYIQLSELISATLHTRSSIGRMGVLSHTTAGLIDAGFEGEITFELFNCTDRSVQLPLDIPIAQLTFHRLETPTSAPYDGIYSGQVGVTPSKYVKGCFL